LRTRWLGRVSYEEAWDLQKAIWEGRTSGRTRDDYVLLLEHPHTYTVGRNGDGTNLTIDLDDLTPLGASLVHVDRGGDITYHGPGQANSSATRSSPFRNAPAGMTLSDMCAGSSPW
jgi:lipoate-protein ligase B